MSVENLSYLKAASALENEIRLRRIGKADEQKIVQLQNVVSGFMKTSTPVKSVEKIQEGFIKYEQEAVLSEELVLQIENIRKEMREIDAKKNKLGNSLYDIPDDVNCREIVAEIKYLREQWRTLGDQIYFIKKNGVARPENCSINESEFLNSLPVNLLDLDRKIKNRKADLSKYKKRLQEAKTTRQQYAQEKNIAQATTEIQLMTSQLNAQRR